MFQEYLSQFCQRVCCSLGGFLATGKAIDKPPHILNEWRKSGGCGSAHPEECFEVRCIHGIVHVV